MRRSTGGDRQLGPACAGTRAGRLWRKLQPMQVAPVLTRSIAQQGRRKLAYEAFEKTRGHWQFPFGRGSTLDQSCGRNQSPGRRIKHRIQPSTGEPQATEARV